MTQEKNLVIKDLCGRLNTECNTKIITNENEKGYITGVDDVTEGLFNVYILEDGEGYCTTMRVEKFKPCLRRLSDMKEKEVDELIDLLNKACSGRRITKDNFELTDFGILWFTNMREYECVSHVLMSIVIDYLNERQFDYRGLIDMGLAIERVINLKK